jgi:hypothetical protein
MVTQIATLPLKIITQYFELIHYVKMLGIIHRHAFYLNHDISETGLCLRPETETISIY